jgi:predicted nucleic acid-binding protein
VLVMAASRELLIADTSFVSQHRRLAAQPEVLRAWPKDVLQRIEGAVIAISVITVAEERLGHWLARWGERRCAQAEHWLAQFVHLPVNRPVAEAWARLKAGGHRIGRAFSANDLWIAATGFVRGVPIVTCDQDFLGMRALGVIVVYLPVRPDQSAD